MRRSLLLLLSSTATAFAISAGAETYEAVSPDEQVKITLDKSTNGLPSWSLAFKGETIIAPSALGLRTDLQGFGSQGFVVVESRTREVNQVYSIVAGKAATASDHYRELTLSLREANGPRRLDVVVRAYDTGAAVRYVLPTQAEYGEVGIYGERTEFAFPADYDCWGLNLGKYHNAHEGEFDPVKASVIREHNLFDSPLVCKTGSGETTFALAESDVTHYPASYYTRKGDSGLGVAVQLPPRLDADMIKPYVARISAASEEFKTPWRVVMLGDSPRDLVASNLVAMLGASSKIADTSWIKGGKSAWDWWNGFNAPVANPGINTETYKAYIDFAKSMGLGYILIDEGWYTGSSTRPKPGSDVTKPIAAVDMPAILKYAKANGIGVMIWLQWQQLDWQLDEAFSTYERWGIAGVKIDFMDRSDQQIVDYFHRVLSKAAQHKLLVDLHGAYAPNGLVRTYPNYITQEGVLGAEYNKWTTRITATHNVTLPFTRMILGPIDYTPGGFANRTPQTFVIHENRPQTQTTRGHGVAMYVVYDSPLVMVSDAPQAYKKTDGSWEDGVDFIQKVPVSWDETRVLQGDIGQFIVTARRKGENWYIGAMTNEEGRTVRLPLDFLKEGTHQARLWQDGATPTQLVTSEAKTDRTQALSLTLAPSGGAAVILSPVKRGKSNKTDK
ncbi:glycoside hydrolase family 97 protein [Asticcacaulis excentricus]|uniref:Glycoside hydrolase 97 n=1 Tax=Asticcacaulis excentricus (strain ATCC 15261 / DSM 4724 / KCTC 12464 / NCIMB 9791 / VKM B-1370 / CB 48) TaxID=573065 RepID=E8RV35_ASTEC|nr:glycoside hydrolase family 97 protein [Asticcacaulis excentricus]ADU14235.1 Glycoside hydrolase 97 [Asticcacaulis excentricus CB 48]